MSDASIVNITNLSAIFIYCMCEKQFSFILFFSIYSLTCSQIITRNDRGVRGVLHATVVAFDKHWNMALSDVLEIWKKKLRKPGKGPPAMG